MRKDKKERLERFAHLVDKMIKAGDPLYVKVFEGAVWAAMSQPAWCEKLKVSDRTLRDLAKCPPIVSTKTVNEDGKPVVLYRLGSTPHQSARHTANIMASIYRKKYGLERVSPYNWGCLLGLAELWPEGVQVDIFRMLLTDFSPLMAAIKALDPDCQYVGRYYQWLPIPLVRKYHQIALEIHLSEIQAKGHEPHPSLVALFPTLWPTIKMIG